MLSISVFKRLLSTSRDRVFGYYLHQILEKTASHHRCLHNSTTLQDNKYCSISLKIEFRCVKTEVKTTAKADGFLFKNFKNLFHHKLNFLV